MKWKCIGPLAMLPGILFLAIFAFFAVEAIRICLYVGGIPSRAYFWDAMPPMIVLGKAEIPTLVVIGGNLLFGIAFVIIGIKSIRGLIGVRKDKGNQNNTSELTSGGRADASPRGSST